MFALHAGVLRQGLSSQALGFIALQARREQRKEESSRRRRSKAADPDAHAMEE